MILITLDPPEVDTYLNGLFFNALAGTASFVKVSDAVLEVKLALNKVNFKSLVCSGVHVDAFCDVKNTPL